MRRIATFLIALAMLFSSVVSAAPTLEEIATSPETFAVCKTVDIASTAYALRTGIGVENNSLVAPLIAHGYFPLFLFSLGIYWVMHKGYTTPTTNMIANGATCGVALSNLLIIK